MGTNQRVAGTETAEQVAGRVENLRYLADMAGELKDIAAREGCVTLAGLLGLAQVEALSHAKIGSSKKD